VRLHAKRGEALTQFRKSSSLPLGTITSPKFLSLVHLKRFNPIA
jgi:hypothetical protein